MTMRRPVALAVLSLVAAACGSSSGYGCSDHTCKATFNGTGSQDMSDSLGSGAHVAVQRIDKGAADVSVEDQSHTLRLGRPAQIGPLRVTLQKADGDTATLRIVKTR